MKAICEIHLFLNIQSCVHVYKLAGHWHQLKYILFSIKDH